MSYLSTISERALLRELELYRDACTFHVNPGPHAFLSQITINLRDSTIILPYSAYNLAMVTDFFNAIQTGEDGVYLWPVTAYSIGSPTGVSFTNARGASYAPTHGKWVDIRDLFTHKVIAVLPWCREFREAVMRAVATMGEF